MLLVGGAVEKRPDWFLVESAQGVYKVLSVAVSVVSQPNLLHIFTAVYSLIVGSFIKSSNVHIGNNYHLAISINTYSEE